MEKTYTLEAGYLRWPEIEIDALELSFLTRLIGTFFSWVTLVLGASPASLSVLLTWRFLVRVAELLACSYTLNLLQGRSISTNLASSSESELELWWLLFWMLVL